MLQRLNLPVTPANLHQPRRWFWRAIGHTYLRGGGWRVEGTFPTEPKFVAIVAPHTSNWDFTLGVAAVWAMGLRVSWLGKHQLFRAPFKGFLRRLGGIPVNRSAPHGVVDGCIRAFEAAPSLMLALAPEGTRKGISQWRTGFYRIATEARVPIFPIGFDFRSHAIRLMPLFHPCGNLEEDLPRIQALFREVHGLRERPQAALA